ncbi:MAG TPA: tetratricopeptide repeat protein, partial [Candidatus Binataceae bacterium]
HIALDSLNAKNYKAAEQQFAKIADAEPNRRIGRLSRFYLANAYLGENDLPHARDALVAFLGEEHDPTFASLALTNLAVIYERMGDFKKAEGAYSQATSVPGPEQARAELGIARMRAKQGNRDGAVEAYRRFLAAHPFSNERQDVLESLAMLGVSIGDSSLSAQAAMPVVMPPAPAH